MMELDLQDLNPVLLNARKEINDLEKLILKDSELANYKQE